MSDEKTVQLLSVDAIRDGEGWTWNNWFKLARVPASLLDAKPRVLFRELRKLDVLSEESKGKLCIEDDQYNIVIMRKNTRQPILALEYGAES